MDKNDDFLNAVSEAVEKTIFKFIGKDFYYYTAPYLSKSKIDPYCNFFKYNKITLPNSNRYLEDEELRTISYLAPYFRARIAYNPKNIDYYLRATGMLKHNQSSIRAVLAYHKDYCGDLSRAISIDSLIKLKNPIILIEINVSYMVKRKSYIDGLDILVEKAGMK